jgi:hypothetical protein
MESRQAKCALTRNPPRRLPVVCSRLSSMALRVLLSVEDSDAEYYIIRMAIKEVAMPVQLHRVSDGEQALWFLQRSHGYEIAPRPDLILLTCTRFSPT